MEEMEKNEKTILIVDDEQPIVDILVYNLKKEGYNTIEASDGLTAVDIALDKKPDLILLDIMLPKLDGLSVCKRIKNSLNVPILMLTAKDGEIDKILGLELGADDYITKPFSVRELVARVKANLRKVDAVSNNSIIEQNKEEKKKESKITVGDLELDLDKFEVKVTLLEKVWGYEYYGDIRTVDVTVRRIREKIEKDTSTPKILITKRGVGYYIASK